MQAHPLFIAPILATLSTLAIAQNDSCFTALPISGTGTFAFDNFSATSSGITSTCQNGMSKDLWYEWTTGAATDYSIQACDGSSPIFTLYSACFGNEIACDVFGGCSSGGSGTELIVTGLQPFTTYYLQLDGPSAAVVFGDFTIAEFVIPANDTCATATPISGTGSFAWDATWSTDTEISWCTVFAVRDVWYKWTSGSGRNYEFDSTGNGFGVNLILRPGCGMPAVACTGNGNMIATGLTPFTDYWLQIEGASGVLDITSGPTPPNNDCSNATPISGFGSTPFNSTFATGSATPASCNFSAFGNVDVWFEWTTGSVTSYSLGICATDLDYAIALYDACNGMELGCSDNGGCSPSITSTQLDITGLQPNTTYLVQVDSRFSGGENTLDITPMGGAQQIGTSYCLGLTNSSGQGATIEAFGTTSVAAGLLRLEAQNLPPNVIGIFYYGTNQTGVPFGNGLRCVSGAVQRLPFNSADASGMLIEPSVFSQPMGALTIAPGVLNFQAWFRDPSAGGAAFNLSDGVSILFVP